ncbi:MAG: hypothetical protein JNL11_00960 [Bdellovibrionaceae bacterium]|nr:hypothetical protein [Pseudobdellovibrionaceae bacterium]
MKLQKIVLGGMIAFSLSTWAKSEPGPIQLGEYTIKDVTHLYPENNYYNQLQDCVDVGGTDNLGGTNVNQPPLNNVIGPIGVTVPGTPAGATLILPPDPSINNGNIITEPPGLNVPGGFASGSSSSSSGFILADQIINIGHSVWSLVERGKPNMRLSTFRANGLPRGIACWTDLEEWKIPKSKVFTVEQKNVVGQAISKFTFRISYVYGGTYNGVGQYLANVTVSPVELKVGWGVDFASEVHIPMVFNKGTKANPIAAMQVFVYWGIGNVMSVKQKSSLFYVTGDGRVEVSQQE